MTPQPVHPARYRAVQSKRHRRPIYVDLTDEQAVENVRDQLGNHDLTVSVCDVQAPDSPAERIYPLYSVVSAADLELARISAAEMCCYLLERLNVPEESLELILVVNSNAEGATEQGSMSGHQIIARIPPAVLGAPKTSLMLPANYDMARQMVRDGVKNLLVDIYVRHYAIPLPGSLWNDRYVTLLTMKELLHLDAHRLDELSQSRRGEDFLVDSSCVPQAARWLAQILRAEHVEHAKQQGLQSRLQRDGWLIPPCIDRLMWADLSPRAVIEACRILSRYYPLIGAHTQETWHHILRLDRRHGIKDYPYLDNIVTFGIENPAFVGCDHRLLQELCRAGKCGMVNLLAECQEPLLFT